MTNSANKWIKQAFHRLKAHFPYRCKCKLCIKAPLEKLEFSHERKTPLSCGEPRGRKERYYDILSHMKSYKLRTHACHVLRMAKQHKRFRKEAQK